MKPLLGISLMHEPEFLEASLPLFLKNEIDVVEWSFDTILKEKARPEWLHQLLKEYSENNRLIGHGVRYSVFDAHFTKRQRSWLSDLKKEIKKYKYNHITEHFGFMSSSNFHEGAPLPVPLNKSTLAIGIDRLKSIQDATLLPVGIENLALSFCMNDVKKQGEFLEKLIKPLNGFIILDVHNIFCQSENFETDLLEIIRLYPLKKVREVHISGGSWKNSVYAKDLKKIRRDTHDEKVPNEIFEILPAVLAICPNVEYIIYERLGNTLANEKEQIQFRKDYLRLRSIVNNVSEKKQLKHKQLSFASKTTEPLEDDALFAQQKLILKILRGSADPFDALRKLKTERLKDWNVKSWKPSMVETAIELIKKWG
jgi:uncharacterized protein (UPF0276 family)